ncbi:MAG TPA: hypothetical protein VER17_04575 [Tepidisphaeraceae bacterium]|nr:hypothetical protein [Tepidisphaeraceae bacterium]
MTAAAAPVAVIDLVTSLLEATVNSVFRFIANGSPYLSRATVEVRRPLQEMTAANHRRAAELARLVESIGGTPTVRAATRSEEQYLAYLSLKFLLPKLVDEKRLCVQRYENALDGVKHLPRVPDEVPAMLNAHLGEQRAELAALETAAAHVAANKNGHKDPSQPARGTKRGSDAGPSAG